MVRSRIMRFMGLMRRVNAALGKIGNEALK